MYPATVFLLLVWKAAEKEHHPGVFSGLTLLQHLNYDELMMFTCTSQAAVEICMAPIIAESSKKLRVIRLLTFTSKGLRNSSEP